MEKLDTVLSKTEDRFWEYKSLAELSADEWESICDGCGLCCLIKLEDEETDEVFQTSVSCQLLNTESCQCRDYAHRFEKVSECVQVSLEKTEQFEWMPVSCAYRLLYENKPLFDWHPLITQSADSVHEAGISVRSFAISEEYIHPDQMQDHILLKLK